MFFGVVFGFCLLLGVFCLFVFCFVCLFVFIWLVCCFFYCLCLCKQRAGYMDYSTVTLQNIAIKRSKP